MNPENFGTLRRRLTAREFLAFGWSSLPDATIVELLARSALDGVLLDMQHGLHDLRSVEEGVARSAMLGKPTLVRVPVADPASVSRVLDCGANGVVMPMIEGAEDARALVQAVKYPPLGRRSFGPARAVNLHGFASGSAYFEAANDGVLAIAMIETPRSYRDLDAILAVEGLDGVFVGPADLSISLSGGKLAYDGPQVREAIIDIGKRVRAAGKFSALYTFNPREARQARDEGYDIACVSSDAQMMTEAAAGLAADIA